jgi:hypothetical protein
MFAAAAAFFCLSFWCIRAQMPKTIRAMAARPPTSPPTKAPTGVEDDSGAGVGVGVGVGVVVVMGSGLALELELKMELELEEEVDVVVVGELLVDDEVEKAVYHTWPVPAATAQPRTVLPLKVAS